MSRGLSRVFSRRGGFLQAGQPASIARLVPWLPCELEQLSASCRWGIRPCTRQCLRRSPCRPSAAGGYHASLRPGPSGRGGARRSYTSGSVPGVSLRICRISRNPGNGWRAGPQHGANGCGDSRTLCNREYVPLQAPRNCYRYPLLALPFIGADPINRGDFHPRRGQHLRTRETTAVRPMASVPL